MAALMLPPLHMPKCDRSLWEKAVVEAEPTPTELTCDRRSYELYESTLYFHEYYRSGDPSDALLFMDLPLRLTPTGKPAVIAPLSEVIARVRSMGRE